MGLEMCFSQHRTNAFGKMDPTEGRQRRYSTHSQCWRWNKVMIDMLHRWENRISKEGEASQNSQKKIRWRHDEKIFMI